MRWTIKNKLLSLSAVGILATLITGIGGYRGTEQLYHGFVKVVDASSALRNHLEADMMHDALRSDVLAALVGESQEDKTTAANDLKEHAQHFREVLQASASLSLSVEILHALKEIQPVLEEYIRNAETLVQLAQKDVGAAKEKLGNFYSAFSSLEGKMEKLSDLIETSTQEAQRSENQTMLSVQRSIQIIVVLALCILGGIALWISRGITLPLQQTVSVLRDLAEGEGDLTKRLLITSRDEIGDLASGFNVFMDKLHDIIARVQEAIVHVNSGAQQLSAAAGQLSNGAQSQAASLEETAASLEQITGAVKQNAENARQANQLAHNSRETANGGAQVVTATVESMRAINASSKKIAEIITVIDEIAFQTNLLALNAAVEAARAGEQGRGFAVVAAEVRNLAQRSAGAAKEIKTLIRDSVQKVDEGSQLVDESGETLRGIVASVKHVTDIIAEISAASQEQSTGVDEVNKAVSQMDQVTQQNAAQTEELSSTAELLADQARQLQALVGRFRLRQDTRPVPIAPAARVPVTIATNSASMPVALTSAKRGASTVGNDFEEF